MISRIAAVFCMPERGHMQRLIPLISGLVQNGLTVVVFTDGAFRATVERAGGRLVDLFAKYSLDEADSASRPFPCRYVSFAARYADPLLDEIQRLKPSLIIYDTFAVIGFLLGRQLGVPYINVCAGHNLTPSNGRSSLRKAGLEAPSDVCLRAAEGLRDRWGMTDAGPFSYLAGASPFLNVYCEPSTFLCPEEITAFEPIAFFGSLSPPDPVRGQPFLREPRKSPKNPFVYASFGSVVWRYFEQEAVGALAAVSEAVASMSSARALISLGGYPLDANTRRHLERPNVVVAEFVDQWSTLQDANVCVTHHGLNSTHEMIYHRVPMISYPFFSDQPALAARCSEFGLAIPMTEELRGMISPADFHSALMRIQQRSNVMAENLNRARNWEIETIDGRPAVIRRIIELSESQIL